MQEALLCNKCGTNLKKRQICRHYVCPVCGNYLTFFSKDRILQLADDNTFREWDYNVSLQRNQNNGEYIDKIIKNQKKTGIDEAVITGEIDIRGYQCAIGVMDASFMMASMGYVVGEKITRLFERARKKRLPVVLFCCSGGARLQEGIVSLMQMEKTVAALKKHSDAGLLYISVLTNPTMGGVTASFAMMADIIIAEKGAKIGFAGERVIEQNTKEKLPKGFQTAEFQKQFGFVDFIVSREEMKDTLTSLLRMHSKKEMRKKSKIIFVDYSINNKQCVCENKYSPWERVQLARSKERPTSIEYINCLFDEFHEFHGDRLGGDDPAIVAGIAKMEDVFVTVVAEEKGKRTIKESIFRNWGMPNPAGYRKVLRLIKQAEKFNRPVICFVDTIGAACGKKAEEEGQGVAIANLLNEMSVLQVPVLSIVISEGGSGGALALAIGNEVWMLENAIYSILTPEGYASIVWKDAARAKEAANFMKLSAYELFQLNIVDKIIPENIPITHDNMHEICDVMRYMMRAFFSKYGTMSRKKIVNQRYKRFRKL